MTEPVTVDLARAPAFSLGSMAVAPSLCSVRFADGSSEHLEPRVMQVLVLLAQAGDRTLSRAQIEKRCWPGRIVSTDALNRVISRLRRLSARSGLDGFVLKTVPRVGYRIEVNDGGADIRSPEILVAVLPFEDTSSDPGMRWLSRGIAEETLQAIGCSTTIRVIGCASSFQLQEAANPVAAARDELSATHVLTGLLQRRGHTTRVAAQLIETAAQTVVWSDRLDIDVDDEFTIQDLVAERVALALDRTYAAASRPAHVDPMGYELYLRGAELTRDISHASQRRAIALLEAATKRVPELADAWGNLALARAQASYFENSTDGHAAAVREAAHALTLDPNCRTARLLPYVGGSLFDFSSHRRAFRQPRPSSFGRTASPDVSFGVQLLEIGRIAEGLEFFSQARRFDPLFQILVFYYAQALIASGDDVAGNATLDDAIDRWPQLPFFRASRLKWAAATGDWHVVDAMESEQLRQLLGYRAADVSAWIDFCRHPQASEGAIERLRTSAFAIGNSGLEELLLIARHAGLAATLAVLAEKNTPLVRIAASRRPDDVGAIALWLPMFASVRAQPEFAALLQAIGLQDHAA